MNPKFVVSHLDEQIGPFDEMELKAKWVKGELLPIDYIYDEDKQDWVLLSERFAWATGQSESATPPPLREMTLRKKRPIELQTEPTVAIPIAPAAIAPIPQPIEVATPPMIVLEKPKPAAAQGAQVKLINGVGEIDLDSLQPGDVELVLQDSPANNLKLHNTLKIHVTPAEPVAVEWTVPANQVCGQDIEIKVQALDRSGHLCSHFSDKFLVRVAVPVGKEFPVEMKDGVATLKVHHTKAENWTLSFHYSGARVLKLPADKVMEWQPGVATKLILDGPPEYIAGRPLKVQVKAVDNFGNVARTFQGTVVLEVKAS